MFTYYVIELFRLIKIFFQYKQQNKTKVAIFVLQKTLVNVYNTLI